MAERQLVVVEGTGEITERRPQLDMSPDKIQLLKDTMCQGATDNELELALAVIQRMQLDPFARQIAFIKRYDNKLRREVMTPQVTIDGARLLAERTRKYGGQLGPWWCGEDGVWHDVWLKADVPAAARVGVIRTDWQEPLYAVARFEAYAARMSEDKGGGLIALWKRMPDIMIAKCAEMLALRRAFPAELSGVYSDDEMGQADMPDASANRPAPTRTPASGRATAAVTAQPLTPQQTAQREAKKALWEEAQRQGLSLDALKAYAEEQMGTALDDLTTSAIKDLHAKLIEASQDDDVIDIQAPGDLFADVAFETKSNPDQYTR